MSKPTLHAIYLMGQPDQAHVMAKAARAQKWERIVPRATFRRDVGVGIDALSEALCTMYDEHAIRCANAGHILPSLKDL